MATAERQDVEIAAHDGTILHGWFYVPAGQAPAPALLMSHGYSATRGMALGDYAARFAAAGFATLVYDHRCLGASEGEPRQAIDPFVQTRDMLTALDWLAARPEVDSARVGLWGTSYSGGEVLVAGAMDRRVGAVIANVPFVGRPDLVERAGPKAFTQMADMVRDATLDPSSLVGPMLVVPEPGGPDRAMMPLPEAVDWFIDLGGRPGSNWRNEVLRPADDRLAAFNPALAVPHLRIPVLFVVAEDDRLAPAEVARAAHAMGSGESALLAVKGHHFSPYAGEVAKQVADATIEFLHRHL